MAFVDTQEKVVLLEGFPPSSAGAPCPAVIATEHSLVLIFFIDVSEPVWDGSNPRSVGIDSAEEQCAVVTFRDPTVHTLGPPGDETFSGHRLASKGLEPYEAFEVIDSAWIQSLEKINAVHPQHRKERFLEGKRHFIVAFHDSVFECVARHFTSEIVRGSVRELLVANAGRVHA